MAIFTLEALEAKHGDALLLHYGTKSAPRLIVIDGGPRGTYKKSVQPRLEEIRKARGGTLEIRMLMVSHVDEDHITGVLDFTADMKQKQEDGDEIPFDILTLWHNSFDDIIAKAGSKAATEILENARGTANTPGNVSAMVAGIAQGRQLRLDADALAINMNSGFDDMIQFSAAAAPLNIGSGLSFAVVGPRAAELDKLKTKWAKELPALLKKTKSKAAAVAEFIDTSVHNLSSIVVLATFDKKTMLLTGDARGDFIIESLKEAKLLTNGKLTVDVLKVPHHGSHHNIAPEFFKAVHARHYVFSANGRDGNPDPPTFDDLFKARPKGPYHLWLTNAVAASVKHINKKKPAGVVLHLPSKEGASQRIELGDKI